MKDTKIQWHPGFVSAMSLEFRDDREFLEFQKEYNLNTKPLEIDLLVIKKNADAKISNEIGNIFRGHNIMEYKSPDDRLDIDAFYKAGAYASLYKAYGERLDERKADDITVSLVRESRPEGLFQYFGEHGYRLSSPFKGIYYVSGNVLFPTQVIVTKEIDGEAHTWLKSLSANVEEETAFRLLRQIKNLSGQRERELADSVLGIMLQADASAIANWKGDGNMYKAVMEFLEPQLQIRNEKIKEEARKEAFQEARKEVIQEMVNILKESGLGNADTIEFVMEKYGLSETESKSFSLLILTNKVVSQSLQFIGGSG